MLQVTLGQFDEALASAAVVTAIGDTTGDPRLLSFAAWVRGWALAGRGEPEAAIEACRTSVELAMDPFSRALGSARLGWAHLEAGDPGTAIPILEAAAAEIRRFGLRHVAGIDAAFLAEALLATGQREAARTRAHEGLAMCVELDYPFGAAGAQRALGRIALADGAPAEARRYLEAALERFTAIGADYEAARTRPLFDQL
jgi:tetratricopeptide (TPR) repeat protein